MHVFHVQPVRAEAALLPPLHFLRLLRRTHPGPLQAEEALPLRRPVPRERVLRAMPGLHLRQGAD